VGAGVRCAIVMIVGSTWVSTAGGLRRSSPITISFSAMEMARAKTHRRRSSLVNTIPFHAPRTPPRNARRAARRPENQGPTAWARTRRAVATQHLESLIRAIPDFPIPGILFRDITPLLKDPAGFKGLIDLFVDGARDLKIDYVVGIEARGYMIGAPLAYALGAGFVPVRKPGKLPGTKFREEYALEYGTNALEIHDDAVGHGQRVLIVDDLLATGGTVAATLRLLKKLGADVVGVAVLIELAALNGRAALTGVDVKSYITY
jgi:adenine phosphoribosyltransferase